MVVFSLKSELSKENPKISDFLQQLSQIKGLNITLYSSEKGNHLNFVTCLGSKSINYNRRIKLAEQYTNKITTDYTVVTNEFKVYPCLNFLAKLIFKHFDVSLI